ncbi:MAG: hypothetical protein JSW58_01570 [Candidatus Latescibacterota bacterium]|nr:MAG: hypothetical protein JSW58_01570 [Candidatus Latescibacterota bacterium]
MKRLNLAALTIFGVLTLVGCAENDLVGTRKTNQPPRIWLSSAPPEGAVSEYTLHLFWGGWDPDGEIAFYEYAITNNESGVFDPADTTGADKWHPVVSNDSIFTFTADLLADSAGTDFTDLEPVDFIRSHTFFIRAVDDEGLRSTRPAYRSFTSRTLSPVVDILVPTRTGLNPAQVPPITTFRWVGKDYVSNERQVQEPDSVRWIIVSTEVQDRGWEGTIEYIRKNPDAPEWSDWHYYRAPGDTGKFWISRPLEFGPYIFAVQVKDEAGAVNPVFDEHRNVRRVMVSRRTSGPLLIVFNRYVGNVVTTSPTTAPVFIDLPAKVPMSFRWEADASSYGGVVSGYRYGWDIQDLSEDEQWDIDWTPFVTENNTAESPARTYEFDSHTFHVEVIDNSGYKSRVGVRVNIVPFTMTKNLIVIDDYREAPNAGFARTNGGAPSDLEHDEFWRDVLSELANFDAAVDMIEVRDNLPIQAIADYKSMIWNTFAGYNAQEGISLLPELVQFLPEDPSILGGVTGKIKPNIVALYMAAGGHVLLCGEQPMTAVVNRLAFAGGTRSPAYPIIFRYELLGDQDGEYEDSRIGERGVGEISFAYNECCLNVLEISAIPSRRLVRHFPDQDCQTVLVRDHSVKTDGLRFTIPIEDTLSFPALELRPEVAGPGKVFAPENRGLVNDIYNPPYFQEICGGVTETDPLRECFQPIYGHGCLNSSAVIYGAPVAFWTLQYADYVPDAPGGVAAKSAIWGFDPVFFKPEQVKEAVELILFEEWQLPRKPPEDSATP